MERETSREYVKIEFTPEEINDLARELADLHQELKDLEEQKSAVASDFGSRIKKKKIEIEENSRSIRNGYEMRHVECEVVRDYDTRTVYFMMDTDQGREIAKQRPMTADEIQRPLWEDAGGEPGEVVDADFDAVEAG